MSMSWISANSGGIQRNTRVLGSDQRIYTWSGEQWVLGEHVFPEPEPVPREPAAAPFTGWRAWKVSNLGELMSLGVSHTWLPGINQAYHLPEVSVHAAPSSHCACGFWAFKREDELSSRIPTFIDWGHGLSMCYGTVEMWGHVVEHELGFRARFVRPVGELRLFQGSGSVVDGYLEGLALLVRARHPQVTGIRIGL